MIIPLQTHVEYPRLVFVHDVDDRDIAPHGYRGDVVVEIENGQCFPLFFFEPAAIADLLADRIKWDFGAFVAEPGLVIIPEITVANMTAVVAKLIDSGYFAHLKPLSGAAANTAREQSGLSGES